MNRLPTQPAVEIIAQRSRRAVPRLRLTAKAGIDDRGKIAGNRRRRPPHRERRPRQNLNHDVGGGIAAIRRTSGEQLVQRGTERVDVASAIGRQSPHLLRRQIVRSPDDFSCRGDAWLVDRSRKAEVDDDRVKRIVIESIDEDVRRLQIAMNDLPFMREVNRTRNVTDDRHLLLERELRRELFERLRIDPLHRDVETIALLSDIEDTADVRMIDPRLGSCLAQHSGAMFGTIVAEKLERDLSSELVIPRLVNGTASPATANGLDAITRSGRELRRLRHNESPCPA
jgi:hypothetical protein